MQNIGMGTSPAEITDADNIATNILYQCNDFGTRTPDPSKPMKRFYSIAGHLKRLNELTWRSTRGNVNGYAQPVTYINWEVFDGQDDGAQNCVGKLYATWYVQFRKPRLDNYAPD